MCKIGKAFALFLTLTVFMSCLNLLSVRPTIAESTVQLSIPEYTVKYVVQPYYIPSTTPTYTTDPYTGKQEILTPGSPSQSGENKTIQLTIKNQYFSPYYDSKYHYIYLSFNVSYKGHFEDTWKYYSNYGTGWSQPNSEYVTVAFIYPPSEGQVDFRVKAQIGYYYEYHMPRDEIGFVGQSGDWSSIQTIRIPEGSISTSTSSTESPTPTPTVPELSWLAFLPLLSLLLSVAVAKLFRKRKSVVERPHGFKPHIPRHNSTFNQF